MFPEIYAAYNYAFYSAMVQNMTIEVSFAALTDTAFWEQYMVNSFQFSAAKSRAEMKLLQSLVFDENKKRIPYDLFRAKAAPILKQFNEIWLRVEYEQAVRGSVMAEQWKEIWKDRDLYPYATYMTRRDPRVRDEHRILDGIRFRIDSPVAQNLYTPNGWNCFHPDMLITTREGLKKIKDVIIGDFVLTRKGWNKVLNSWCNGIKKVYKVCISNDSFIHTFYSTDSHRIYTEELSFIEINKLDKNKYYTFLRNSEGFQLLFKAKITIDKIGFETPVYDLMVENEPEFFVNNILVHNCRCFWDTSDNGDNIKTDAELEKYLYGQTKVGGKMKDIVAPEFRNNVGINGIFPSKKHSYFDILGSANDANYTMFKAQIDNYVKLNTRLYSSHQVNLAVNDWHEKTPSKDRTEILFRNHDWMLNIRMNQETINKIGTKTRGFENIRQAVEHPTEIWARWNDPEEQKDVRMNYILTGADYTYVVETFSGLIQDAYLLGAESSINNRRIGVKMIR